MDQLIQLHDKQFKPFIPAGEIEKSVLALARQLNRDLKDKNPLFIGVLNGSFLFTADLFRHFEGNCEVTFIKYCSYKGMKTTGEVKELIGMDKSVENRHLVLIEDIIDTGNTIECIYNELLKQRPASLKVAALLLKPEAYKKNIPINYVGMEIPDKFIVGYGLDYDGLGRNLKDIYVVSE